MPRATIDAWAEVSAREHDARLAAMAAAAAEGGDKEKAPRAIAAEAAAGGSTPPWLPGGTSLPPLPMAAPPGAPPRRAGCVLRNIYGATEATVHQCSQVMRRGTPANRIGGALAPGTVVLVASWPNDGGGDGDGCEPTLVVPPWELAGAVDESAVGEVTVRGATVARGYLNRPALTAAKFRATPKLGKLYRTGDLARWVRTHVAPPTTNAPGSGYGSGFGGGDDDDDDDNARADPRSRGWCLELLGRLGRDAGLVKVNGQRVEVGEVEAVLKQLPLVRDAAVLVVPPTAPRAGSRSTVRGGAAAEGAGAATAHSLAAVVVLRSDAAEEEEEGASSLDEHAVAALLLGCAAALPRHMVPARFGTMARPASASGVGLGQRTGQLPLTGSGKLDYRRLGNLFARAVAASGGRRRSDKSSGGLSGPAGFEAAPGQVSPGGSPKEAGHDRTTIAEGEEEEEDEEDAEAVALFVRPGAFVAPRRGIERVVAAAWATALGLPLNQVRGSYLVP
jgi:acyl-CoA synthetase (AMP-forming)/AMP-acid ligase II